MYDDEDNDGKFPDESLVEVRYPRSKQEEQGDRERWPWLPGTIVEQCGPEEWYVCVEVRELAVLRNGRRAPRGTASRNLYYPCCFRDGSEIRPRTTPGSAASATRRGGGGPVTGDRVIRFTTAAVVCAVAAFAAVVSYSHIYGLGRLHGQDGTAARLLPLSVDGLILAASLVLLHEARNDRDAPGRSRRTTAGATATGLQNTTMSPVRICPSPAAVSAVRSPSRSRRRSGDRRSAARTATIPAPARSGGHPPGTAAALAAGGRRQAARHGTVQRHEGLRGRERLQQPLLLPGAPPGSTQPGHNTPPCRITNPAARNPSVTTHRN